MIPFRWIGLLLTADPNAHNDRWHRFLPLTPIWTQDYWLVIPLVPIYRIYYPSTDWEGSNWGYGYRFWRPVGVDTLSDWTIGGTMSRLLWLMILGVLGLYWYQGVLTS